MVHTCPRCELRFPSKGELDFHLRDDHPDAQTLERLRYKAEHEMEPLYADHDEPERVHRYLVLANQTLGGIPLRTEIERRAAEGPCEFIVMAPATHSEDYASRSPVGTGAGGGQATLSQPHTDEVGVAQARWRLRSLLAQLQNAGLDARGTLGPADPYAAAGEVLESERVDEVLLSTLPPALSAWLGLDLPQRIHRRWNVKVTTIVAER